MLISCARSSYAFHEQCNRSGVDPEEALEAGSHNERVALGFTENGDAWGVVQLSGTEVELPSGRSWDFEDLSVGLGIRTQICHNTTSW